MLCDICATDGVVVRFFLHLLCMRHVLVFFLHAHRCLSQKRARAGLEAGMGLGMVLGLSRGVVKVGHGGYYDTSTPSLKFQLHTSEG